MHQILQGVGGVSQPVSSNTPNVTNRARLGIQAATSARQPVPGPDSDPFAVLLDRPHHKPMTANRANTMEAGEGLEHDKTDRQTDICPTNP